MHSAQLTKSGAERICRPELTGRIVLYESIHPLGLCVKNVYFQGQRLCGILSFKGVDRGLIIEEEFAVGEV